MSIILLALALCIGGALGFLVFAMLYISKAAGECAPDLTPSSKVPTDVYSGQSKGKSE